MIEVDEEFLVKCKVIFDGEDYSLEHVEEARPPFQWHGSIEEMNRVINSGIAKGAVFPLPKELKVQGIKDKIEKLNNELTELENN